MFEKRFALVPAQVFTADGGADGSVIIADTSLFKVKQVVIVTAVGQTNLELEVKNVVSPVKMIVGPVTGNIKTFTNLSAYTTSSAASISANEQKRPTISADDFERAVYEEEPTVAKRVILVDQYGNKYDDDNPLPTSSTFSGSISVGEVAQGTPNSAANAWPVKITDGTDSLNINSDGSINVNIASSGSASGLTFNHNEITAVAPGVETTLITLTPISNTRVQKIEVSGENYGLYRVKLNGTTLLNKRSWWTDFNATFTFEDLVNGLLVPASATLTVTVIHNRPDSASFEVTVMSV